MAQAVKKENCVRCGRLLEEHFNRNTWRIGVGNNNDIAAAMVGMSHGLGYDYTGCAGARALYVPI